MSRPGPRSQNMPPPGSLSGLRGKKVMDPGSYPSLGLDTLYLFPKNTPSHSGLSRTKKKTFIVPRGVSCPTFQHPEESAPFHVSEFPGSGSA